MDGYERQEGSFGFDPEFKDRSVKSLVQEMVAEAQHMAREELRLFKAEVREDVKRSAAAGRNVAIGGVLAHTGLLALAAFVILLLATFMAAWLSALLVGAALCVGGGLFAKANVKRIDLKPGQTTETLKEDKQWANRTMRGALSNIRGNA